MTGTRIEHDSLGTRSVPVSALYGIQTLRAVENFPISGTAIGRWPQFIAALAAVKKSCAISNSICGRLEKDKCEAIVYGCEQLAQGDHLDQFPVDVLQGGAGTSTNMNVNEVITNLALQYLGHSAGRYDVIHPNDHVNMSQSTNDVYPTAARLACLRLNETLIEELRNLVDSFELKSSAFGSVAKLGRTQLQDAVPMTLGQEFSAFATVISEDIAQNERIAGNFLEICLGGTAIGTGLNAPEGYADAAVTQLAKLSGLPFRRAINLLEATWDLGAFVLYSGMLKRTATKLSKIANDIRLLSSGPRGGLGEIRLPERQPGSSIMPGKVNPVIPEIVNQVAFAVIGNDVTITLAAEAGQLQLNAMAPVLIQKTFESVVWLTNAARVFNHFCIVGIEADETTCLRHLNASTALVTALVPELGYQAATDIVKSILQGGLTLPEALQMQRNRSTVVPDAPIGAPPSDIPPEATP
jgi:aspartate ammonia-lyase